MSEFYKLPQDFKTFVQRVREEVQVVRTNIESELPRLNVLEMIWEQLGSYLYGAAERLLVLKDKQGSLASSDEALTLLIPRLFNECFGAIEMARNGMPLQATVLTRSGFEIGTLGMLFMQSEDHARSWLQGNRISPDDVRHDLRMPGHLADLYRRLSRLSHANYHARALYSFDVPGGTWNFYGALRAPKAVGLVTVEALEVQLLFLENFYGAYEGKFRSHGIYWRDPSVAEVADQVKAKGGRKLDWMLLLGMWKQELKGLRAEYSRLPDDAVRIADFASQKP